MPTKIVDFSARSTVLRDEPFHLHFWECTPSEYLEFLAAPRAHLKRIGIKLPRKCRIETTIENHGEMDTLTKSFTKKDNGTIVCNTGGGNVARTVYRIISYAHDHDAIGKYKKDLLHSPRVQYIKKR